MRVSVLTIVQGRQKHLENQMRGLMQSKSPFSEWIIVGMNQDVVLPEISSINVRFGRVDNEDIELPLAEARNRAVALCKTEGMIFLDVDCIPSPTMVGEFREALSSDCRLWMGSARYLPREATIGGFEMDDLNRLAVEHPLQPRLSAGQRVSSHQYELFWSLCFASTKTIFDDIGGFDESFSGYGAEDTDFAFSARAANIPFGFLGAVAYHQHHRICKPPLNHFSAIVRNAEKFRRKWNEWPMVSWLNQFADMNLIHFDVKQDCLEVLRQPSQREIDEATSQSAAGF